MKRRQRRLLAHKWAKMEMKRRGVPRRQLKKFVRMFQGELLKNPNYRYSEVD